MKKLSLTILVFAISVTGAFSQNNTQKEEVKYKHSIGASLWMISNFFDEPADFYLLTYGYQLTPKDRIFVEFNTWKYNEPLGTYGDAEELYRDMSVHGVLEQAINDFFGKGCFQPFRQLLL